MLRNSDDSYGLVSRIFHWLIFILFALVTFGGHNASEMENTPEKLGMITTHKSVGLLILSLLILRILWRISSAKPKALSEDSKMNKISNLVQILLLILILAQPVLGMLMSQAAGQTVSFFSMLKLPIFVAENKEFAETMHGVHARLWLVIVGVLLIHVAGSLKQHFIAKNRTLIRMIKG